MHIQRQGTVILSDNPRQDAQFYVQHLGFQLAFALDWYVSLQHPELTNLALDFLERHHPANAAQQLGQPTSGVLLAFVVTDVEREEHRLRQAGVPISKPLTDEPWGQRRFQVSAPGQVMVEILQPIPADETWLKAQMA